MKTSVYMTWAKQHAAARYNLANSGILSCNLSDLSLTPDDFVLNGPNTEGYPPLREAIAARYGVTPTMVTIAPGTSMANTLAMAMLLSPGDEVLFESPTYECMLASAEFLGARVVRFSRSFENGHAIDADEVAAKITPRTKLIVLTSPHNPSGVAVDSRTMARLGELAAAVGAHVLVDEVYRDILTTEQQPCVATMGGPFITTNSLTKCYGLSGLRCGWILCSPALTEKMRRANDLFGVASAMPADSIAVAAFRQLDQLMARTRSMLTPNATLVRQFLCEHADLLDCVVPANSMCVFPRLRHLADSEPLHDQLRALETSIVPGKFFENPQHFRLGFAVKTADIAQGLRHVSQVLRSLH